MSHKEPTVEEYLLSKTTRREYYQTPVGRFKGILMALEVAPISAITGDRLRSLVKSARQAAKLMPRIRDLSERRKVAYEDLTNAAAEYSGFGGFDIPAAGARVRIRPEDSIEWDGPALKERLGKTASAVVGEKLRATLVIPLGHQLPDGTVISAEKATALFYSGVLAPLGFSEDDEATTAHTEVEYTVNEERLAQMVLLGQVESLEGTGQVTREFKPDVRA